MWKMIIAFLRSGIGKAMVQKTYRDVAKAAAAIAGTYCLTLLMSHGYSAQDAAGYATALGGAIFSAIVWLGGFILSLLDAVKVDSKLTTTAETAFQLGSQQAGAIQVDPQAVNDAITAANENAPTTKQALLVALGKKS